MSLEDLRNQLSSIDRRIIELIAERQTVVGAIGAAKQETGRATRDFEREKDVLDTARAHAGELDVDPNLAEEILTTLIRASLTHQERSRVMAEAAGDGRRALIIGGSGKMGGWFVDYFSSQGFLTVIADTGVTPGPGRCRDWRQAGTDYDVIVVATPMAVSGQILTDLAALKPEGLIFDIGSLKSPLKAGLGALNDAGCKVASLHPMFGPDTELLSGRHLIFVDAGCERATAEAKALFSATMVEELDMSLDDHDRLIAYVLGLSHALNIAFFTALAESGEAAPKLAQLSSTTFDAQLLVSGAVARDNPRMYFEIQSLNDFGMDPLDALCDSAARIRDVVASGDEEGFVELMQKGREYLATRN
ncbi:MAG: prephenate dehydrogenase/arogenate dehydrogenase family protein [Gammaproteobacteria bacterium]|nr:prephenate dehydrogenase/arogenate dehydrogenase family protein [Gammaproteobacteria bacterium]